VFLYFQTRLLGQSCFADPKSQRPALGGVMPPNRMREVENALKLALNLSS
jgi:hypothetical protein